MIARMLTKLCIVSHFARIPAVPPYRTRVDGEVIKSIVPDKVPNYDPENPEIIFN
jgi:hypothetical protein